MNKKPLSYRLQTENFKRKSEKNREDTIIITGREITIIQKPFIEIEIKAARIILQNIKKEKENAATITSCTVISSVKIIES